MQQAELVDLALDNKLATRSFPITKVNALYEQINRESGGGDADFELYEFLTFLVHLAFAHAGAADPAALEQLLSGLRRSRRVEALGPMLESVQSGAASSVVAAGEATLASLFAEAGGGQPVGERAMLEYLESKRQIRAVVITLPGKAGDEGSADLTWQDASAAFQLCGGGSPLSQQAFGHAMAVCGLVKYNEVKALAPPQRVEGFLANLTGSKDEQAVVG